MDAAPVREHHLDVRRTARYFTLGGAAGQPEEIWLVCHGYAQLAAPFLTRFEALNDGRRLIVAPEGLSRFYLEAGLHGPDSRVGASWMTREDRLQEIEDYIGYLDALHDAVFRPFDRAAMRLIVLGFSQGTATASRWAVRGKARVDRLVLWAGLLPPDVDPGAAAPRLNAMDLVLVAGDGDEYASPARLAEQRSALENSGVRHRVLTFHGGHAIEAETLKRVAAP
jgi:predicted esterase